ncbi:PCYCGC motif-containing (lipo)protein [Paenibacillus sp. GCM10028914]|uniref:PCYCGC motif-containing (lipo)protein n=1 Tax=Paenibacillus sp. GCM10028914 TaxID=3273416 RepID=UPI00361F9326
MQKQKFVVLILSVGLLLSGCGAEKAQEPAHTKQESETEATHEHGSQSQLANGDIQEITASVKELPTFLNDKSQELRTIYALAAQVKDVLQWIPCYCGCGESAGHENNLNCFIDEVKEDGSVVWDDHGTRCGVCLDIAVESAKLKSEGKSLSEIRTLIDEKYKTGFAKPTPTPMPTEAN